MRKLAKIAARIDQDTYVVYVNGDGTYGFCTLAEAAEKTIVEYVSKY